MSDCPDCENTGFAYDGEGDLFPCPNWRHRCRPSLEEIADHIKRGVEPPRPYKIPIERGEERSPSGVNRMGLYLVKPKEGDAKPRLVKASTQSGALRHVAKDAYSIVVAKPEECLALGKDGVEIEDASAE
jgi:hypothetical protein